MRNLSARTLLLDLLALTLAITVASIVVLESVLPWNSEVTVGSPIPMLVLLYVGAVLGSLLARQLWRITVKRPSYVRAFLVAATATATVALGVLGSRMYWSRPFLIMALLVWLGLMLVYRAIWRAGPWLEKYGVVTGHKELADELAIQPHADVLWVMTPDMESVPASPEDVATILVDGSSTYSSAMSRFVADARTSGATIRTLSVVYEEHTGMVPIAHDSDGWGAPMAIQPKAGYLPLKRLIDIAASILLAPLALITAIPSMAWVKANSPGDAIFSQTRVGLEGETFTIYKIRTMSASPDEATDRTAAEDSERITKPGRVLRRLHIDEIPQLWNVVKGDLSIVGPRPEQVKLVDEYETEIPFYSQREIVRPGITGWAQVHHGYASGVEETVEKLGYDLFYIKHMSIWLDLRILGRTVWAVVTGFGAR